MTDQLSNKMDRSIIGALLTGHAQKEWNELKTEAVVLEEKLAEHKNDAMTIRTLRNQVEGLEPVTEAVRRLLKIEPRHRDLAAQIAALDGTEEKT